MQANMGGWRAMALWREIRRDLAPARLLPVVVASLVIALAVLVSGIGVAALAFTGSLQEHIFIAIGLVLFGTAVMLVVMALGSSWPGTIGAQQEVPAVLLGLFIGPVYAALTMEMSGNEALPYVIVAIAVATVTTGVCFWLLGRFGLGGLIRFIPYPVIGGVLAGLGWLMIQGGLSTVTGATLSLETLAFFAEDDTLRRVAATIVVAVFLLAATRLSSHFLVLPGALALSVPAFYVLLWAGGGSVAAVEAQGWLLGPFPQTAPWQPIAPAALAGMDWALLAGQWPVLATLVLVSTISVLLYASGMELAVRQDMNLDRELRSAGLANIGAGLVGGAPGFHCPAESALGKEMGAAARLTGILTAGWLLVALFVGLPVLAYVPVPVLGGLLFYIGIQLLHDWLVRGWRQLPAGDYAVVVVILLVASWFGYLEGIAAGVLAGVILFTVNYSRVSVTKHVLDGRYFHSNVDRAEAERELLARHGDAIHILTLQGFIFFGTADKLIARVRERLADKSRTPLRFLCLDFRRVNGIDTSSAITFRRLDQLAQEHGFMLVLAGLAPADEELLISSGFDVRHSDVAEIGLFRDLDHALEWCEEQLLEAVPGERVDEDGGARLYAELEADGVLPYTREVRLEPGERLIRQGDRSSEMFFLIRGRVSVHLERDGNQHHRLRTYDAGTVVGEMALYWGGARSASVIADAPITALQLDSEAVQRMTQEQPEIAAALHRRIARLLAVRLAQTTRLREMME